MLMKNHSIALDLTQLVNDFSDLQGNILIKHGKQWAAHLLLRFRPGETDQVLHWIRESVAPRLTRTVDQLIDIDSERFPVPYDTLISFLLTAEGYRQLGYDAPNDRAFQLGMHKRPLNDPSPNQWDSGFTEPEQIHALLLIAADQPAVIEQQLRALQLPQSAVQILTIEWGHELAGGLEHFGFVDGISQPIFIREEWERYRTKQVGRLLWDPATRLDLILVDDPNGQPGRSFGSYMVFRKLAQDVGRFAENVKNLAEALTIDEDTAAAWTVGRFKDGTPVSQTHQAGLGPINNFNFESDQSGVRCPFHSHIRKVNPRGENDFGAETPDTENRIARRGMPYGELGDPDVGMLFMCFQSSLVKQFELIQINWSNFGDFGKLRAGVDPISGQANSWERDKHPNWPKKWGEQDLLRHPWQSCVTMRGGAYFFAPSPSFLLRIS